MSEIRARDLQLVESEARELFPRRAHRIRGGRIGHAHWFVAILRDAADIVRRTRAWEQRRTAR